MTADWTKQTEEMVKGWTTAQQKMMESMFSMMGMGSMGSMGNMGETSAEVWNKSADTWHETMKTAIEGQVTWAKFIADSFASTPGVTPQLNDMATKSVEMTRNWSEGQLKILNTYFEAVKSSEPSALVKNMNVEEMLKLLQTWQEASQKMMETQMEMVKTMSTAATDAAK